MTQLFKYFYELFTGLFKLIKRIPLLVWALFLIITSFSVVQSNFIPLLNTDEVRIFSALLTLIGLVFVALNLQKQWKNELIKTEYLNQPEFEITGYEIAEINEGSPSLCGKINPCNDVHWFDIHQKGELAAIDISIALFNKEEGLKNIMESKNWDSSCPRLNKGESHQFKLPKYSISTDYFSTTKTMQFLILIDYKSEYSGIRYKRIYQLGAMPPEDPPKEIQDWVGNINYYFVSLRKA